MPATLLTQTPSPAELFGSAGVSKAKQLNEIAGGMAGDGCRWAKLLFS